MIKFSAHSPTEAHKGIQDNHYLRIDEGIFTGVEFTFKDIMPTQEDAAGNMHMNYDYDVWFTPKNIDENVTVRDFQLVIEDILMQVINDIAKNVVIEDVELDELVSEPRGEEFDQHEIIKEEQ